MVLLSKRQDYCEECQMVYYSTDGPRNQVEAEEAWITHKQWYHFTEESIKGNWAMLAADISTISGMVANDEWFEAYVESADIYERILLGLRAIRIYSGMATD